MARQLWSVIHVVLALGSRRGPAPLWLVQVQVGEHLHFRPLYREELSLFREHQTPLLIEVCPGSTIEQQSVASVVRHVLHVRLPLPRADELRLQRTLTHHDWLGRSSSSPTIRPLRHVPACSLEGGQHDIQSFATGYALNVEACWLNLGAKRRSRMIAGEGVVVSEHSTSAPAVRGVPQPQGTYPRWSAQRRPGPHGRTVERFGSSLHTPLRFVTCDVHHVFSVRGQVTHPFVQASREPGARCDGVGLRVPQVQASPATGTATEHHCDVRFAGQQAPEPCRSWWGDCWARGTGHLGILPWRRCLYRCLCGLAYKLVFDDGPKLTRQ